MGKKFICNSDSYFIFSPENDTIALPVSQNDEPEKIEFEGLQLFRKSTFHVSLVCIGKIQEKYQISDPEFVRHVLDYFCEYTQSSRVSFDGFRDEYWFASEGNRRSIIRMCDVQNLQGFFDVLNSKYNVEIEYPPTHVTLFTLQPEMGIFLTDKNDLARLARPISNPM